MTARDSRDALSIPMIGYVVITAFILTPFFEASKLLTFADGR